MTKYRTSSWKRLDSNMNIDKYVIFGFKSEKVCAVCYRWPLRMLARSACSLNAPPNTFGKIAPECRSLSFSTNRWTFSWDACKSKVSLWVDGIHQDESGLGYEFPRTKLCILLVRASSRILLSSLRLSSSRSFLFNPAFGVEPLGFKTKASMSISVLGK